MNNRNFTPSIDASLGLIYRLNNLWPKADSFAIAADYDAWNNVLDALFRNLDYEHDKIIINKDGAGKILSVSIEDEDYNVYRFLSARVFAAKRFLEKVKLKPYKDLKTGMDIRIMARDNWYNALVKKDRWLRKLMQKKKIYLKTTEQTPGTALFGSFAKNRRY